MAEPTPILGFGETFDMAAADTAGGQLLTLTAHRGNDAHPPHQHTNDYLCLVLAGGFAEQQRGDWREHGSGSFFAHRAGEPHQDRISPLGAMCLNLHFGPEQQPAVAPGRCSGELRVTAARLAFELVAATRDELTMSSLAAEIVGRVWSSECAGADGGRWMARIIEAICDEPARRWTLAELAAIAGRHPVHVAQAFRARMGLSLGAFQRVRRLTRLGLALRRSGSPLAALADEFGYCDQSHMSGEFRGAFGTSPGRYRRQLH